MQKFIDRCYAKNGNILCPRFYQHLKKGWHSGGFEGIEGGKVKPGTFPENTSVTL